MPPERERRVVAITGAAGGIGRALAWAFAAGGARLALLDVDEAGLRELTGALEEAGHPALALPCDLREADRVEAAFAQVRAAWGGVDLLVANAGLSHRSLFVHTDAAVIRQVMEVNFFGSVHCTRAVLGDLIARRGQIAVISTVAGFAPLMGRTGYAASKHALHGFFDTLRAELHHEGVSVSIVCPWFVATPLRQRAMGGDGRPVTTTKAEVGRAMSPEEVASAVVHAVRHRRELVVLSPMGRLAWWLSRLFPRVYAGLMRRSQRREFLPEEVARA